MTRPLGNCPLNTPGCVYSDCSTAPDKSCFGPNAPRHVDMDDPIPGQIQFEDVGNPKENK